VGDEPLGGDIEERGLRCCSLLSLFRAAGHNQTVVPRCVVMIGMCVRYLTEIVLEFLRRYLNGVTHVLSETKDGGRFDGETVAILED
jgi:hypothetical protein